MVSTSLRVRHESRLLISSIDSFHQTTAFLKKSAPFKHVWSSASSPEAGLTDLHASIVVECFPLSAFYACIGLEPPKKHAARICLRVEALECSS
jgi:hypothetical protein